MDSGIPPNITVSDNSSLTSDEVEMYKYALGIIVLLMVSVYYISKATTRTARLNAFMWSCAIIGGTIAGFVASYMIPPKYPEIVSLTPDGYGVLHPDVKAPLVR